MTAWHQGVVFRTVSWDTGRPPSVKSLTLACGALRERTTLSLATRGINMENFYEKEVEAKEEAVKETSDLEETKVQQVETASSILKTDSIASLRNGDGEIQNSGSLEKPDVAESNKDGECNKQSLKSLQAEEITPKSTVSLEEGNLKISNPSEVEQTSEALVLSVEDNTPGAYDLSKIDQKTSKGQEIVEEDVENENSKTWETGENRLEVGISFSRSENTKIRNARSSEDILIPNTRESNKAGEKNKKSSTPLEIDSTSEKGIVSDVVESINESGTRKEMTRVPEIKEDSLEAVVPLREESTLPASVANTSEAEKTLKPSSETLKNGTIDSSKHKKELGVKEQTVPVLETRKQRQRRNNRKRLRARLKKLLKSEDGINAENRSKNEANVSRSEITLGENQGEKPPRSKGGLSRNQISQGMLPVMPVDSSGSLFRIQENRCGNQQYPTLGNQGNQQYSPLYQGELSALPSTSRGGISYDSSGSCSGNRKRKLNDSSSGNGHDSKRPRHADSSMNFDLTRVIITDSYRKVGITKDELGQVRSAISQEIDQIRVGPVPRFNDAYLKLGGILVESADVWSRDWLINKVPQLYPWTGARLRVVNLESLENFHAAIVWIPGLIEKPESVLRRLEKQNPSLRTGPWRVLSGEEKFTPRGYNLIMEIPDSSVRALRKMEFKPFLGLTRVHIVTRKGNLGEGQGCSSWR